MNRTMLSKAALILFMGFVSTAMTVNVGTTDSDFYTCHLLAIGKGETEYDYDCEGTCQPDASCKFAVWYYTVGCKCDGWIPSHACSGEFSFHPDPQYAGLFCYTVQGCMVENGYPEDYECLINNHYIAEVIPACRCGEYVD